MTVITEQDNQFQIAIANTLRSGDIQCHICNNSYHQYSLLTAQNAITNGATIVALTTSEMSPLRQLAHFTLDTLAIETSIQIQDQPDNYSIAAQQTLTDLLFIALAQLKVTTNKNNNT